MRQNRGRPGFRSSIDLIGKYGKDSIAGFKDEEISTFGIAFRLRTSFFHVLRCEDQNTGLGQRSIRNKAAILTRTSACGKLQ